MDAQHYHSLTPRERGKLRAAYVENQNGLCYHCKSPLGDEPPPKITKKPINWRLFPRGRGFLDYPIHLHHDHKTGMTIGAVHARCNAVLWQYHGE